jgi:hypothetical protein
LTRKTVEATVLQDDSLRFSSLLEETPPMTAVDHTHSPPRRLPSYYVMFWGFLAALALTYMAVLASRPDIATAFIPLGINGDQGQHDKMLARAITEITGVKQSVTSLQKDLSDVRTAFGVQDERIQSLTTRIGALEPGAKPTAEHGTDLQPVPVSLAPIATPEASVAAAPQAETPAARIVTGTFNPAPVRRVAAVEPPPAAPPAPVVAAAPPAAPVVPVSAPTSWSTSAKSAAPATKSPPVALQLSTGPSLDSLRLSWQLLMEDNRGTLKTLLPRYVESGTDPSTYALIAGPIVNPEEAQKTCNKLKARRVTCTIAAYEGNPL